MRNQLQGRALDELLQRNFDFGYAGAIKSLLHRVRELRDGSVLAWGCSD